MRGWRYADAGSRATDRFAITAIAMPASTIAALSLMAARHLKPTMG